LSACQTSGAIYSEVKPNIAQISKNKARLFVYRENSPLGSAIQPSVYLDGVKIGVSVPNSFIMKDIDSGKHELSIATEVEKKYDFVAEEKKELPKSPNYINKVVNKCLV
jgi:hypothetical protein